MKIFYQYGFTTLLQVHLIENEMKGNTQHGLFIPTIWPSFTCLVMVKDNVAWRWFIKHGRLRKCRKEDNSKPVCSEIASGITMGPEGSPSEGYRKVPRREGPTRENYHVKKFDSTIKWYHQFLISPHCVTRFNSFAVFKAVFNLMAISFLSL